MDILTLGQLLQRSNLHGSYVWVCRASVREGVKTLKDWFVVRISEVRKVDGEAVWVYFQEELEGFTLCLGSQDSENYRFSAPLQEPECSTI